MKKIIFLFIILGLLFFGYQNRTVLAEKANQVLYRSPCDTPKTFSIGTIDPRFNLSKDELIEDAKEAGSVWKNKDGMALLQYDPDAALKVNMIYDQRQSLNTKISNLDSQAKQQKATLKPEIADYEKRADAFNKKTADLNAKIDYWNKKGGAPKDEYDKIAAEQQELKQEATQLQQEASTLNQSTDQYNAQIQAINQNVDTYNAALQYKPEEGEYIRNGAEEKIDIYFNNSRQELIHTLAHEMGHAIGLEHNMNVNSIMYPRTTLAITPSVDDEAALTEACKKQTIFQTAGENLAIIVSSLQKQIMNALPSR